ncbi:DUF4189 domain-containing protein [Mycobacterium sp.]|uniref:DUF4189 domain-containing protein n=1 Tax=Mycobacterium sp. TaxID=1785 RepID=UPI002C027146|nr:DUF4189 domain-containing protein [Mycobacterium sp.]HTQ22391.1 DUF4189 domain-containing protein [Mycobacterium sp.]
MEMRAFRRAAVVVGSMAAVTAMSAALAPSATADDQHGALAIFPPKQVAGRSLHASTKAAADAGALSACGYSGCQVLVDFTQCGAIAQRDTNYVGGYGATLTEAELNAAKNLGGSGTASIVVWGCN